MKCTCALKKEHLDPVPEVESPIVAPKRSTSSRKPRLLKAGSDNSLTVFTNGHHKPVHKHNDSAHKCGLPYTIPIPHSVHGNADVARRSADSLPLVKERKEPSSYPQLSESISRAQQELRHTRSEQGSPEPKAVHYRDRGSHLPPLDLSSYPLTPHSEDFFQSPIETYDNYYSSQDEGPVLSAGLSMAPSSSGDWTATDLPLDGAFSAAYSQPPSYASFDHSGVAQPALTTSSSGGASEATDYDFPDTQGKMFRPEYVTPTSSEERSLNRRSASSYTSIPQTAMLSSNNLSNLDFETYIRPTTASPTEFEEPGPGMPLGSEAYERHGMSVHDAQMMAHPDSTDSCHGITLPVPIEQLDSVWLGSLSQPAEVAYVSQTQLESGWRQ